jgi:tetrapyrrole methylase family protein/MazG family protein
VEAFVDLVRLLRGPGGCPWDAAQTHHSLSRHLVEEAYEVVDAITALPAAAPGGDIPPGAYDHLEEELGDLLFQVVFHSVLAAEAGAFDLRHVATGIHDKLVTRHPHVFGDVVAETPDRVMANWEQIKAVEKGRESAMDDIPAALPSLLYAHKLGRRAAAVGFDWPPGDPGLAAAVRSEVTEVEDATSDAAREEELGDLLFMVVNWARHLKVDPEAALRRAAQKFSDRFRVVERLAAEGGISLPEAPMTELDRLWLLAKAEVAAHQR